MSDFDTYTAMQRRMMELLRSGEASVIDLPEFQAAWRAAETIKNRHGGMPPTEVTGFKLKVE